ncbi:MAG TPA: ROK family protein, partial [Armatimonadota bacterium]|nr:ROK family protein [Armatimonadota bacterium]
MTRVYAGIDLGGTNFRLGLRPAGPGDARLIALESRPADGGWSPDDVVELVEETLVRVTRRSREPLQLAGLGMGLTGDIDCLSGVCHSMKRFPGLEGAPIRDLLQGQLGVPVHLLNDGLTAALGELRAGAGQGV